MMIAAPVTDRAHWQHARVMPPGDPNLALAFLTAAPNQREAEAWLLTAFARGASGDDLRDAWQQWETNQASGVQVVGA